MISSIPQQRARVSQQELRYLWVWVSLSATEAVQEVLLEGHPSKQYLEEIHRLLVDVQQRLLVSQEEVWVGRACARVCITCVRVGLHACGGPGLSREDENTWKVTAHPELCGKNGGEEETASDDLGEAGMPEILFQVLSLTLRSWAISASTKQGSFGGEGRRDEWVEHRRFLGQ